MLIWTLDSSFRWGLSWIIGELGDVQRALSVKALDTYWRDHLINMNRLRAAVRYKLLRVCCDACQAVPSSITVGLAAKSHTHPHFGLIPGQCPELRAHESPGGVQDRWMPLFHCHAQRCTPLDCGNRPSAVGSHGRWIGHRVRLRLICQLSTRSVWHRISSGTVVPLERHGPCGLYHIRPLTATDWWWAPHPTQTDNPQNNAGASQRLFLCLWDRVWWQQPCGRKLKWGLRHSKAFEALVQRKLWRALPLQRLQAGLSLRTVVDMSLEEWRKNAFWSLRWLSWGCKSPQ